MLTAHPPPRIRTQEALVNTDWPWPGWERFLLGCCAAFHLVLASALFLAPDEQIVNAGTQPVFDLAARWVWGVACTVAGSAALLLLKRRTVLAQMLTWFTVIPLGFAWSGTFLLALLYGRGSAIGVVVFPTIYLIFGTVAVRIGLRRKR